MVAPPPPHGAGTGTDDTKKKRKEIDWNPAPIFSHKDVEKVRAFAMKVTEEGTFRFDTGGGAGRASRYKCCSHVDCQAYRSVRSVQNGVWACFAGGYHTAELNHKQRGIVDPAIKAEALHQARLAAPSKVAAGIRFDHKKEGKAPPPDTLDKQIANMKKNMKRQRQGPIAYETVADLEEFAAAYRLPLGTRRGKAEYAAKHESDMFCLGSPSVAGFEGLAFSCRGMFDNLRLICEASERGDVQQHVHGDGTFKLVFGGWVLYVAGAMTHRFDEKSRQVVHTFRPFAYMFTRSENTRSLTYFFESVKAACLAIHGFEFKPSFAVGDHCEPLRAALDECFSDLRFNTCSTHIQRKGKNDKLNTYRVKPENRASCQLAIDMLHRSTTREMMTALGERVVVILERMGEAEYAHWLRDWYLKEPWCSWYVSSTGSFGWSPDSQPHESYNNQIKTNRWYHGLRQPTDAVLEDAIPRLLHEDCHKLGAHKHPSIGILPELIYPSEGIEKAAQILSDDDLYKLKGGLLFTNVAKYGHYAVTDERIQQFHKARAGKIDKRQKSIEGLEWTYVSLHMTGEKSKFPEILSSPYALGCTCKFAWRKGPACSHCALYECVVLKTRDLNAQTEELPKNKKKGKQKKSRGALSKV